MRGILDLMQWLCKRFSGLATRTALGCVPERLQESALLDNVWTNWAHGRNLSLGHGIKDTEISLVTPQLITSGWPKKIWNMNPSAVVDDQNSNARKLSNTELPNSQRTANGGATVPPREAATWTVYSLYGKCEALAIAGQKRHLPLEPALRYWCPSQDKDGCQW